MKQLKILLINPFDAFAGSQRVFIDLILVFKVLKFNFNVLLGFGGTGFISNIPEVKSFIKINSSHFRKSLYPIWLIFIWPRIFVAIIRSEIVWANTIYALPAALPMVLFAPRRLVIHLHEINFPFIFKWLLYRSVERGATALCVSDFHKTKLGIVSRVVHNHVSEIGLTRVSELPIVLFVGMMTADKGFPLFIEVAQRLPRSLVHIVACVPSISSGQSTLYEQAQKAGIEVRFGLTNPIEIFTGASLLLQCTDRELWTETFSLVSVEAIANGVPVVTAGMEVGKEILGEALAFDEPTRDPDLIALKIINILENPDELERLRGACILRVQDYSFEKFKDNILDVVNNVQ